VIAADLPRYTGFGQIEARAILAVLDQIIREAKAL